MAKKQKRVVKKKVASAWDDDELEQDEEVEMTEEVSAPGPGIPRIMVTWHGSEGETRPGPKQWHGIAFEQGKPTPVEHLPPAVWDMMRKDIDAGDGVSWSYEHVVEHPAPEPEPPPPEEEIPPPESYRSSRK